MLPTALLHEQLTDTHARWARRHDMYAEDGGMVEGERITRMALRDLGTIIETFRAETGALCCAPSGEVHKALLGVPPAVAPGGPEPYHPVADVQTVAAKSRPDGGEMADEESAVRVLKDWHLTTKGCMSCSIQVGKQRALLMQRVAGGMFYLRKEGANKNEQSPRSLSTRCQQEALRAAAAALSKPVGLVSGSGTAEPALGFLAAGPAARTQGARAGPLNFERLLDEYWASAALDQNDPDTRSSKTSTARVLLGFFGHEKLVVDFTHEDFGRLEGARLKGGIKYVDYDTTPTGRLIAVAKRTDPVKKRTVQSDLILLRTMFNWARRNLRRNGDAELTFNPIEGYKLPKEENPIRRIMPQERFEQIRDAGMRLATSPDQPPDTRLRMAMFTLAFVATELLGRRIKTVRLLTRHAFVFNEAADFEGAQLTFLGQTNKNGGEDTIPIPAWFARMVYEYCEAMPLPASGALFWILGTDRPLTTDSLDDYFDAAEHAAGLDPVPFMKWHSLRRKWATERKDLPIGDVMVAGGWRDLKTMTDCYQMSDPDTVLRVINHGDKLHSDGWVRSPSGESTVNRRAILPSRM